MLLHTLEHRYRALQFSPKLAVDIRFEICAHEIGFVSVFGGNLFAAYNIGRNYELVHKREI